MSIGVTIGLKIEPSHVRLITPKEARYAWKVDDSSIQKIFERHLSRHSVGAYKKLCEGVGRSFRAVAVRTPNRVNFLFFARALVLADLYQRRSPVLDAVADHRKNHRGDEGMKVRQNMPLPPPQNSLESRACPISGNQKRAVWRSFLSGAIIASYLYDHVGSDTLAKR